MEEKRAFRLEHPQILALWRFSVCKQKCFLAKKVASPSGNFVRAEKYQKPNGFCEFLGRPEPYQAGEAAPKTIWCFKTLPKGHFRVRFAGGSRQYLDAIRWRGGGHVRPKSGIAHPGGNLEELPGRSSRAIVGMLSSIVQALSACSTSGGRNVSRGVLA